MPSRDRGRSLRRFKYEPQGLNLRFSFDCTVFLHFWEELSGMQAKI